MNLKIVFYYLGWVLNIEAVLMLLPCAVSLVYGDGMLPYFLVTMIICTVIGFMTAHKKPADTVFYAREGFLTRCLSGSAVRYRHWWMPCLKQFRVLLLPEPVF